MSRQRDIEDLALVTAELLEQMRTVERYDWRPTRDGLGGEYLATRPDGEWTRALPKPKPRRHTTKEPGLLVQLGQGAGRRRAVLRPDLGYGRGLGYGVDASALVGVEAPIRSQQYEPTALSTPGPVQVLECYVDLVSAIDATRQQMRAAAGKPRGARQSAPSSLRELTRLLLEVAPGGAPLLDDQWAARALRRARAWSGSARIALSYDAPTSTLNVVCSECGGDLRVRQDASSDVWCAGRPGRILEGPAAEGESWPRPDRGCGARWPRMRWIELLDETEEPSEEAAG